MILVWTKIFKFVGKNHAGEDLNLKPEIGFEYDSLHYDINQPIAKKTVGEEETNLSDEECLAIENFINAYDFIVYPILEDKTTGDPIKISECSGEFAYHPQPAIIEDLTVHTIYNQETHNWDMIHCVNDAGEYVGNMSYATCPNLVPSQWPTVDHRWNFETNQWEFPFDGYKQSIINYYNNFYEEKKTVGAIFKGYVFPISDERISTLATNIDTNVLSFEDEDGDEIEFDNVNELEQLKFKMVVLNDEINDHHTKVISFLNSVTTLEELDNAVFDEEFFNQ